MRVRLLSWCKDERSITPGAIVSGSGPDTPGQVAIGLISGDTNLAVYAQIITPVVLTTVVLSELIGPLCARYAVEKAGEVHEFRGAVPEYEGKDEKTSKLWHQGCSLDLEKADPHSWCRMRCRLRLFIPIHGSVTPGLVRIATLLAYHFKAVPMPEEKCDN